MKKKFIFLFALMVLAKALIASLALMYLWNALFPHLFAWPVISFTQSMMLLVLSRLLFPWGRMHRMRHHWKRHLDEKLSAMSPEEKEKFRAQWEQRCGKWGRHACAGTPTGSSEV